VLIDQIKDSRIEPVIGEPAVTYALGALKREHTQEAVQRQAKAVLAKGDKSVVFSKAHQPAPAAGGRAEKAGRNGSGTGDGFLKPGFRLRHIAPWALCCLVIPDLYG
jgi:hypothetical protein